MFTLGSEKGSQFENTDEPGGGNNSTRNKFSELGQQPILIGERT